MYLLALCLGVFFTFINIHVPGEGNGKPLQYSCLENPMDRRAWRATIHRITKSWTRVKRLSTNIDVYQDFSTSVLWSLWTGSFLVSCWFSCSLKDALPSTEGSSIPSPKLGQPKFLQIVPHIPRGDKIIPNWEPLPQTHHCIHNGLYQFSSVTQSCPTHCDPMNHSTPGLPVHQQLRESTQTHVHRVGDAIRPSHPLLSPSPPAFNLSQHPSHHPSRFHIYALIYDICFSLSDLLYSV